MFFDVTHAQYNSEYRINLEFEDGSRGTVDLSDYIKPDTVQGARKSRKKWISYTQREGFYTLLW
jgi:hypothetical protein